MSLFLKKSINSKLCDFCFIVQKSRSSQGYSLLITHLKCGKKVVLNTIRDNHGPLGAIAQANFIDWPREKLEREKYKVKQSSKKTLLQY